MTTKKTAKIYTAECAWGCGTTVTSRLRIPAGGIGCGQGECAAKHNAAAEKSRREVAARRAATRKANAGREPVAYGDYGQLVAFVRKGK